MSKGRRPTGRPSGARRTARSNWPGPDTVEVTVTALGARGDGLAQHESSALFVVGALPGERVRARVGARKGHGWQAHVTDVLQASAERIEPACPHFGPCGGCTIQHLSPSAQAAWKRQQVVEALIRRGFPAPEVDATVSVPPGQRRRCTVAWRRTPRGALVGFHAQDTHRLEDVRACAMLTPALFALMEPLRALVRDIARPGEHGQAVLTMTDTGAEVALILARPPDLAARERLAAFAEATDLARLRWMPDPDSAPEPLAERRPPVVTLGEAAVVLPPLAFLQPSRAGGDAITASVLARLPEGSGSVLDLFAGVGTLSFPLAGTGRPVHAVDAAPEALSALAAAIPPHRQMTTACRDLERDPLQGADLTGHEVAVFDPPRAGARAQAAALAQHGPDRIIAVSCNPSSFARDARALADGGYTLGRATPIDQFPWSAHVELVAGFSR
ncbi:TRAM domain-containing protein [Rhodospira trueperi]|uniref:23S rRNA (Uracil1939-C5)-methyltransferase n=1 Tax=Rhodospira trueperi TaxID=69960 RepID=A0A1G7EY43_9PROT|nr:TRAM domain-containing protein [Rhodospira trueperi]SDE68285.1 23S rRNA (uracil1939-C5)-methyltransferase [Rhodospira trueperi]